jgi:hypothetical protein
MIYGQLRGLEAEALDELFHGVQYGVVLNG